jgi:aminoglycoside phosphotransferase (APT) family kinase protein
VTQEGGSREAGRAPRIPGIEDPGRLGRWISANSGGQLGELQRAELIAGGRSNLTYRLDLGGGPVVLRRPPLGHVLPTAHDMAREYRVLSALSGTDVPVPAPITATWPASSHAGSASGSYRRPGRCRATTGWWIG